MKQSPNDELPPGWGITPLGNVASFEMGQAPPGSASNFEGKGTAFVKAGEFGAKRPVIREWTTEPKKFAAESDVLICVVGATAGKLNLGANCAIGRSVASIRPSKAISQLTLYYQLLLQVESLRASSTGSAQGVISKEMLGAIEVAIPPLAEQKRIADKLEAVLGRVDACRARLDRVPDLLKRFRQSVLAAATSGQLTEDWREESSASEWDTVTVGDLCLNSFYGPRFGKDEYTTSDEGVPTVRTTDMTKDGRIVITGETPRVMVAKDKLEHFRAQKGDLLITRTGSIGVMAVFDQEIPAMPSAYLIRFRFSERVLPRYVFFCLMSPKGQESLGLSTTAVAQPNINAEAIKGIEITLPTPAEQAEIVRRVEALFALADRIEARLATAQRLVERLTPATLSKAFRGDLVPQDPNDEPASKLLERLRGSERPQPKTKRKKSN